LTLPVPFQIRVFFFFLCHISILCDASHSSALDHTAGRIIAYNTKQNYQKDHAQDQIINRTAELHLEFTPKSHCEERGDEVLHYGWADQIQVKKEMDCFAALAMTPF
jgi:hypothetical protein